MSEYEILRLIWWALLGILLTGFAVMDGFDLGTAALLPFVGRTDKERRVAINAIGPVWEGNQAWFILGGGATIATAGAALFPFLLPSSAMPDASLTVWDSSSSRLTLAVMLGVTALILPVVCPYTGWAYRVLRGPVSEDSLDADSHSY